MEILFLVLTDGQPLAENSQPVSSLSNREDKTIDDFKEGAEVFNEDKNSVRVEPTKEEPQNVFLTEKEKNHLTSIPHAADKITTAESCPDVGQLPSTLADENGEDVLKQETTAQGMSPLEISKVFITATCIVLVTNQNQMNFGLHVSDVNVSLICI